MLFLRGLVVAIGGMAFIFLPGAVIGVLSRRGLRYESTLLLWGLAVLAVALLPSFFLTNMIILFTQGDRAPGPVTPYWNGLLGGILTALFVEGAKYLLLRWRKIAPANLLQSGVMLGLGVGLLTKVFQGLILLGAGIRLIFGDTSTEDLAAIAARRWPDLLVSLAALITDRFALVMVSAALGALVARALIAKRLRWLWLAVVLNAAYNWVYNAIGLALGADSLIASALIIVYEGALAVLVLRWLSGEIAASPPPEPEKPVKMKPGRRATSSEP